MSARTAPGARLVVQTWLGTRLLLALVALVFVLRGAKLTDVLTRWDAAHYLTIAADGYANPSFVAFFPGWPLLIRSVSLLGVPAVVAGTALALVASAVAAAALYRMAGAGAAVAWLLAPTAVFTMVPYTESVFCAAAFWAWERASARKWPAAAVLASVAAAMRISGLFLIVALVVLALTQPGRGRVRWQRVGWLVLPVLVLGSYLVFLRLQVGTWTAWYDAQASGWSRELTWPWVALQHTIDAATPGGYADAMGWAPMFAFELVSMAAGVLVVLVSLFRKRWGESVWVGLQVVAFSLSYWFMSVNRALLLWFPLWEEVGRLGQSKGRLPTWRAVLIGALVVIALAVQVWWAWRYFGGAWAS